MADLNEVQRRAKNICLLGHNLLIHGEVGSGKTYTLL